MKKRFLIANWKSNKTSQEALSWLEEFKDQIQDISCEDKEIIVCPPFTQLCAMKEYIDKNALSILLGGQDISPFGNGSHTGEINAHELKEFASYVIIGHSERRIQFHEEYELLKEKVSQALASGLTPIFCVSNIEEAIPDGVTLVAYEPLFAIGSGKPDSADNANKTIGEIKKKSGVSYGIYGGSVNGENAASFSQDSIDGLLVGKASLNPVEFSTIVRQFN